MSVVNPKQGISQSAVMQCENHCNGISKVAVGVLVMLRPEGANLKRRSPPQQQVGRQAGR